MSRSWVDPCGADGERERLSEGQQSEAGRAERAMSVKDSSVYNVCVRTRQKVKSKDVCIFSGQRWDFLEAEGSRPG